MTYSARPVLRAALYVLNFGVVACLLAAAFFLSQGLFGDLYSCNERTLGDVVQVYDVPSQPAWPLPVCTVDLNYTAVTSEGEDEEFYALEVTIPCNRLIEDENQTVTTNLCYNRYHPELFGSLANGEDLVSDYRNDDDDSGRDMELGFKAALWMALLGFLASGLHRHTDAIDRQLTWLQEAGLQAIKHARARCGLWRFERRYRWRFCWRRREEPPAPVRESELQTLPARETV